MSRNGAITRRAFMGTTAAAGAAALARAGAPSRVSVAMWDFSWLTRREPPEAEYADWDEVLDGLCERGYGCVRIDAFPHLIAAGPEGETGERFTMLPQKKSFFWGNHEEVEIEPRAALSEFMGKCRERGVRVGLSSWFQPDKSERVGMMNEPADFTRVWTETLGYVESLGFLDMLEWVDLCNEFPLAAWAPGAYKYLKKRCKGPFVPGAFSREGQRVMSDFFRESISPLKARFPGLNFCYSYAGLDPGVVSEVDYGPFGIIEPHIWLNGNVSFALSSGLWATLAGAPGAMREVSRTSATAYYAERQRLFKWLDRTLGAWEEIAGKFGLPLYTTEAWGPVNYDDAPPLSDPGEWAWVKDAAERAIDLAISHGWRGMCTSNFCGPQFEGMWSDVDWHRRMTRRIQGG